MFRPLLTVGVIAPLLSLALVVASGDSPDGGGQCAAYYPTTSSSGSCHEDQCLRALQMPTLATSDCSSYLLTTIIPPTITVTTISTVSATDIVTSDITFTATVFITATMQSDITFTTHIDVTSTSTEFATETSIVDATYTTLSNATPTTTIYITATTYQDTTFTTVIDSTFTTTIIMTENIPTSTTSTLTSTSSSSFMTFAKRDSTPMLLTIIPSSIPHFASSCSGSVQFSSACSCLGITASTTTLISPSTTITLPYSNIITTIIKTITIATTSLLTADSTVADTLTVSTQTIFTTLAATTVTVTASSVTVTSTVTTETDFTIISTQTTAITETTDIIVITDSTVSTTTTATETAYTTVTPVPTAGINFVQNPDFANGTILPWVEESTSSVAAHAITSSECSGSGSGTCFQLSASTTNGSPSNSITIGQNLSTLQNEMYTLSYAYNIRESLANSTLTCGVGNSADNSWTLNISPGAGITPNVWYFANETFTASSDLTNLACNVYIPGASNPGEAGRTVLLLTDFSVVLA